MTSPSSEVLTSPLSYPQTSELFDATSTDHREARDSSLCATHPLPSTSELFSGIGESVIAVQTRKQ